MGGKGQIGIKLGAGDLTDTVLPGQYQSQRFPAVSARADVGEELETWNPNERQALLFRFWNALMDAYGRPPARSISEFEQAAAVNRAGLKADEQGKLRAVPDHRPLPCESRPASNNPPIRETCSMAKLRALNASWPLFAQNACAIGMVNRTKIDSAITAIQA